MNRRLYRRSLSAMILCLLFAVLMICPAGAEYVESGDSLETREDGSLHILLITDSQDTDQPQKLTTELLRAEVEAADVDLVIFLGDNIYGPYVGAERAKVEAAIRAVVEPVVEKKLPFVVAFGNHDDQECLSKEEQLEIYRSYPGCLNQDPDIPGVGNTCLPVTAKGSSETSILLWVMDSGTYAEEEIGGYGYVKEEQNQWFRDGVASYGADRPVSYVFQHIPVPQVYTLLTPAKAFEPGAVCTFGDFGSDWYKVKEGVVKEGKFGEAPSPSGYDSGQFQSWKDCGVKAAFFGHDHTNDYIANVEGIDLVSTCGVGFYSYGRGDEHGARILVLHTDRPDEYDTKMVYYKDLIDKPLTIFQAPHLGTQLAKIVFPVLGGAVLLLIAIIVLIVLLVRRAKKKKALKAESKA